MKFTLFEQVVLKDSLMKLQLVLSLHSTTSLCLLCVSNKVSLFNFVDIAVAFIGRISIIWLSVISRGIKPEQNVKNTLSEL